MIYNKPPDLARKDALTPQLYNRMRDNGRYVEAEFRSEHIRSSGEHNTPLIARTLGTLRYSAGYSLQGFNSDAVLAGDVGVYNPSVGRVFITLPFSRGYSASDNVLMVQNASATGASVPCFSDARFFDDRHVEVYSYKWNAALGAAGSWLGEDASSYVAVHGEVLQQGPLEDFGGARGGGQGLRVTDYNKVVQGYADLEVAYDVAHRDNFASGSHNVREVARSWAHVQFDGTSAYTIVEEKHDDSETRVVSITRSSAGQLLVTLNVAVATPMQVFVDCDWSRLTAGALNTDLFMGCVVNEGGGSWPDVIPLYIYKRGKSGNDDTWARGDTDFQIWIHTPAH
jgi:hypothetical protein